MVWRLARVDLGGRWGWAQLVTGHVEKLHELMSIFEAETPRKLRGTNRMKDIPPEHLCRDAQKRLAEISQDDAAQLTELRFGHAKWRVWGVLNGSMFDVLWWDPDHTVCPVLPKDVRRH
jgi:hypothetical protein